MFWLWLLWLLPQQVRWCLLRNSCSVFISIVTKQKVLKWNWLLCSTSPSSGKPFLMTEPITQYWSLISYSDSEWLKAVCCELLSLPMLFIQIGHNHRCDSLCIHCLQRWFHQLCCTLNKDSESNDDDWLIYSYLIWCSSAISFLIPRFLEATFLQSWLTLN